MQSAIPSALENLDKALDRLDSTISKTVTKMKKSQTEPELALPRNEREVNRRIAAKLDQTIDRLETLLSEE